jgi:hypothetical protein
MPRGGFRTGSGRKKSPLTDRRTVTSFLLENDLAERMKKLCVERSLFLNDAVREKLEKIEKETKLWR